ncbi:MAG: glycosyltransferase family 4 protein, partial [Mesorhizobium sp.]
LKDNPGFRERLGQASRKRKEETFSLAAVAGALDRLLTNR